jgi:hypothetical protein
MILESATKYCVKKLDGKKYFYLDIKCVIVEIISETILGILLNYYAMLWSDVINLLHLLKFNCSFSHLNFYNNAKKSRNE